MKRSIIITSNKFYISDVLPESIPSANICENIPPKPPTSPIPSRIEENLQEKQLSLLGNWNYNL